MHNGVVARDVLWGRDGEESGVGDGEIMMVRERS